MTADVIIIGAGISGLACALELHKCGLSALVLDASEAVGGRIRTDMRNGFLLDRGFQVLQTWYPEARRVLDYETLDLRAFDPGALVRFEGHFHRVTDIWRRPSRLLEMLVSPVGTVLDKLHMLALRRRALRGDLAALYARPETDALSLLTEMGFSQRIIERFFKPFFAGVFFEPELDVSSRAFEFVFRAFALGDTAIPARGMGTIPAQLATKLPPESIRLNTRVQKLLNGQVELETGERLSARVLVVATGAREAARLLVQDKLPVTRGTTCFYFAAERPPLPGPHLILNGTGRGIVNSLVIPSNLSEYYAPAGAHLITVNLFGTRYDPAQIEYQLRKELFDWFGHEVTNWEPLAVYRLPEALPAQTHHVLYPANRETRVGERLWVCGEFGGAPSIQWALHSGARAGASVAAVLGQQGSG